MAVTFVTTGRLLHADATSASPDGYKTVPISMGGKSVSVRVKDAGDPLSAVSSSSTGKYDPERIFSATSSMANKAYSLPADSVSQGNSDFKNRDQGTFITRPYVGDTSSSTMPNLNSKVSFSTARGYNRNATGFDKSYNTSSSDVGQSRTAAFTSSTDSADQNHTALLGGPEKPEVFAANSMANKQYLGPGALHAPDDVIIKDNVVISRMSGLPDRPLSIDEVRNLINHGTKPNTDERPDEPSKPLNDPDYKPEPLRDTPAPASDDAKNDPVPAPGTMAAPQAPENSEPLPQP